MITEAERSAAERAITNSIYEFADAVDTGDIERYAHKMRCGTIRVHGIDDTWTGSEGVKKMFADHTRFYDGIPNTKHVTTNLRIQIDDVGNTGTAQSYYMVLQAMPGFQLQVVCAGRYYDTFERRDDEWLMIERFEYLDLVGDLSAHIMDNPHDR